MCILEPASRNSPPYSFSFNYTKYRNHSHGLAQPLTLSVAHATDAGLEQVGSHSKRKRKRSNSATGYA